jgi:tetratricopeptide (TPR) repeat protein
MVSRYEKVAEANPKLSWAAQGLAEFLRSAGGFPESVPLWEKLVAESPGNDDYRMQLGHALWELADQSSAAGRHDEANGTLRRALEVFEKLAADFPGNPFYRQEQGFTDWKLGLLMNSLSRQKEAEEPFRHALAIYKQLAADYPQELNYRIRLARSCNILGETLVRQGQHAEGAVELDNAVAEFTKAIALKTDAWEGWNGRAFVHFNRQQWNEAVADFTKAIELAPQVHTNWWHRGHAYLSLAQWDKAATDFGYVIDHWPDGPDGRYLRAVALAQMKEPDKALADLRQAIALGFDNVALMISDSRLAPLRTREDFGKLLQEVEPKSAEAHNNLAWLLATCPDAALRNPRRAVELASKAVELERAQGMYRNTLGVAHYRAGDWTSAVEALNKSIELREGGDAFDWFFLAMAEWQRGNKDDAGKWYDKAATWRAEKARDNEELGRFEAEAREVLGLKKMEDGG